MKDRAAAMRSAKAEAEDYMRAALEIIDETPAESATSAQIGRAHGLATSYVQLAGEAVNRFQEVARGA